MKKLFSLLLLLCLVVTLTACGSDSSSNEKKEDKKEDTKEEKKSPIKTLTCVGEEDESGINFSYNVDFNYDEDKKEYTDGIMSITIDYKGLLTEEELIEKIGDTEMKCEDDILEDKSFTSCKAKLEGTKYTQEATIDLSNFDVYDLKENNTLEKLKEAIENDEDNFTKLTCTIK